MMLRTLVMALLVSNGTSAHGDQSQSSVSLRRMTPGQHLRVTTKLRVYDLVSVDPASGEMKARVSRDGGRTFAPPCRLFVLGATPGRKAGEMLFVRAGVLAPKLKMELGIGSLRRRDRAFSETVTAIRLD